MNNINGMKMQFAWFCLNVIVTIAIVLFSVNFIADTSRASPAKGANNSINIVNNSNNNSKININTCSKEALTSFDGVGEFIAEQIIENRPYVDIWSLCKVKGVSKEMVLKIREEATASD